MAEKCSYKIENTVGKGEIARYEQFLLFPLCFLKALKACKIKGLFGKSYTIKVPIAPNYKGVCLQNTSKPHSYHLKIW